MGDTWSRSVDIAGRAHRGRPATLASARPLPPSVLPGHDELFSALHAGPLEMPPWQGFLAMLRVRVGADFCGFYFRQGDAHITDSTEISATADRLEDLLPAYKARFHRLDPVPYDDLVPGRVYRLADFIMPGDALHQQYLRDFLVPGRRQFQRIMRVTAPGGYNAFLLIWRATREFDEAEAHLLASLGPQLAISLKIYSVLESERVRALISAEAVQRLNFGWLRLDAKGRVLDRDGQAEDLMRNTSAVRIGANGRLCPKSATAGRLLDEALADFARDPLARPRAVRLSEDPWIDMLLRPASDRALSGTARPIVTIYLHGDRQTGANRVEQFVQLFGLTPSEAKLGLALTRGRSIAEAAAEQGISVQTARTYSKLLYGKTGARGQADLVRILLASAASLA